jgi:hypothetical protein
MGVLDLDGLVLSTKVTLASLPAGVKNFLKVFFLLVKRFHN